MRSSKKHTDPRGRPLRVRKKGTNDRGSRNLKNPREAHGPGGLGPPESGVRRQPRKGQCTEKGQEPGLQRLRENGQCRRRDPGDGWKQTKKKAERQRTATANRSKKEKILGGEPKLEVVAELTRKTTQETGDGHGQRSKE